MGPGGYQTRNRGIGPGIASRARYHIAVAESESGNAVKFAYAFVRIGARQLQRQRATFPSSRYVERCYVAGLDMAAERKCRRWLRS